MKNGIALLALCSSFLLGSCAQYHYSPNFIKTPYLDKKGDLNINAGVSGGISTINADLSVAYSPVQNGMFMLNYFRHSSSYQSFSFSTGIPSYLNQTRGQLFEAAAGYYKPLSIGTFALYAGGALGQVHNDYGIERIANLNYRRFFVQPTIQFKNDWFRIGGGLRFVSLQYTKGTIDHRIEPADINSIKKLESASPFFFPELGGNMGFHFKPFTLTAQWVLMISPQAGELAFDGFNGGVGLGIELNALKKRKTSKK